MNKKLVVIVSSMFLLTGLTNAQTELEKHLHEIANEANKFAENDPEHALHILSVKLKTITPGLSSQQEQALHQVGHDFNTLITSNNKKTLKDVVEKLNKELGEYYNTTLPHVFDVIKIHYSKLHDLEGIQK